MKKIILSIFILLSILSSFFGGYNIAKKQYLSSKISTFIPLKQINEQKLFDLIQKYRYENYLPTYNKSDFLCKIANQRLQQIKTDFSHAIFVNSHYCDNCVISENLAKSFYDEQVLFTSWLNSPTHAQILKEPYTHSCLKTDENNTVQIFGYY